jgi:hypothetical protein
MNEKKALYHNIEVEVRERMELLSLIRMNGINFIIWTTDLKPLANDSPLVMILPSSFWVYTGVCRVNHRHRLRHPGCLAFEDHSFGPEQLSRLFCPCHSP